MAFSVEKLRISNFAGIQDAEVTLGRMTILVGPQASGKSICVKLCFFFKQMIQRLPQAVEDKRGISGIRSDHRDQFLRYFPSSTWSSGRFEVSYEVGEFSVQIKWSGAESSNIEVIYSPYFRYLYMHASKALSSAVTSEEPEDIDLASIINEAISERTRALNPVISNRNYFVSAGRSFFSAFRASVPSLIATDVPVDPFLAEFWKLYDVSRKFYQAGKSGKKLEGQISKIIGGTFVRVKNEFFIDTDDGRHLPIEFSSSGQQEVLPLLLTLARFARMPATARTLIIEEPEAHLFPEAQQEVVQLLASVARLASPHSHNQYLITTHSPYILSAVNNLMYAGKIISDAPSKKQQVLHVVGDPSQIIDPAVVTAYFLDNGTAQSIIDDEAGLIQGTLIDGISDQLAVQFGRLVDIEFKDHAE